jgi:hypothetical protein
MVEVKVCSIEVFLLQVLNIQRYLLCSCGFYLALYVLFIGKRHFFASDTLRMKKLIQLKVESNANLIYA